MMIDYDLTIMRQDFDLIIHEASCYIKLHRYCDIQRSCETWRYNFKCVASQIIITILIIQIPSNLHDIGRYESGKKASNLHNCHLMHFYLFYWV